MSDTLAEYPLLLVPLLGWAWSIGEAFVYAARGEVKYTVRNAAFTIVYASAVIMILFKIGIESWQWQIVVFWQLANIALSAYTIVKRGWVQKDFTIGSAVWSTIIIFFGVYLLITGAPATPF